jgi:hypothetical protein
MRAIQLLRNFLLVGEFGTLRLNDQDDDGNVRYQFAQ